MNTIKSNIMANLRSPAMRYFMLAAVVLALAVPTFAQTPVPIVVDTNQIFTQTNTWIAVFAPILAIGIGISIALALLTFIGQQIVKAFH